MEIPKWMTHYIEGQKHWDDDIRQEVYLKLLEMEQKDINKAYIQSIYLTKRQNTYNSETRRRELEEEHTDQIRRNFGLDGESPDPSDLFTGISELHERLSTLSALMRETVERVVLGDEDPNVLAEEEGVPTNTIHQRVWQAKKQLRGNTND